MKKVCFVLLAASTITIIGCTPSLWQEAVYTPLNVGWGEVSPCKIWVHPGDVVPIVIYNRSMDSIEVDALIEQQVPEFIYKGFHQAPEEALKGCRVEPSAFEIPRDGNVTVLVSISGNITVPHPYEIVPSFGTVGRSLSIRAGVRIFVVPPQRHLDF